VGRRGPAKTPTELKLVTGSAKAHPERINRHEPKPRNAPPEAPDDLSDDVREVWDHTVAEIEVMITARAVDRDALLCFCEAVVIHRRASRLLAGTELLTHGAKGNVVRNPLVQIQRDAAMVVKAFAAEFGLTPRARAEFSAPAGNGADDGKPNPQRLLS